MRAEIRKIQELMEAADYVTDAPVATSIHLAMTLRKPLLIEGHAGVGKTEVAKVMARMLGTNLIRLQCYEGLDAAMALYEWNYQKQLLHIKLEEGSGASTDQKEAAIFSEPFLLKRPLLQAITQERSPVLLVDEIDRCVPGGTLIATASGLKRAALIEPGDLLLSFDPARFRLVRSRVRTVIPREAQTLLRIFVGGRLLDVTPEHRFVRYSGAGAEVVEASELRRGDRLPLQKTVRPPQWSGPRLDLDDAVISPTDGGRRVLSAACTRSGRASGETAGGANGSMSHPRAVVHPGSCRASLRPVSDGGTGGALATAEYGTALRPNQTPEFYELLGYIVAAGGLTRDRLCIAGKDRVTVEAYAGRFERVFGVRPRVKRGPHRQWEATCQSLPPERVLRCVLGSALCRRRDRTVPDSVFGLPPREIAGFVRGFFDGQGRVGDRLVAARSASAYLLVGVQHLLSILGVDSRISRARMQPRSVGRGPRYTLTIPDVGGFARAVGFCSPAKERLDGVSQRLTHAEPLSRCVAEPALRRLGENRGHDSVPSDRTVSDILPGRVRRPHASPVTRIAQRFEGAEHLDLGGPGVVLGEVTSIEGLDGRDTVWDFVLEGEPYFVANQVVTHNCDEEFEAFLLEIFSEWQITIPEVGPIKATHPPHVILTSNRNRELSDALRRRCLYLWVDYPSFDKEVRIVERKVPGVNARVAREIARFMESLRAVRLSKVPGVAETLDWAQALTALHADHLDAELVAETLGCVLKDADDIKRFQAEAASAGIGKFIRLGG